MRGVDISQPSLFFMKAVSDFVPKDRPLRALRLLVDEALDARNPLFDEHFSVDGTHQSTTDPDAELMRKSKGTGAALRYGVDHVMESRHGLVVAVGTRPAATVTEREAAIAV